MFATLRDERVTVAGAVPTQWAKLLDVDGVCRETLPNLRIGVEIHLRCRLAPRCRLRGALIGRDGS
jgi:hypothetical protein